MLLALYKKLLAAAKQTDQPTDLPIGTLTFATPYPQLRYGEVDGIGTVEIDQTGNMVGFSPVERCSVGGETAWIPLELVKNIRWSPFAKPITGQLTESLTGSQR
jgi:hypothetical protein